jgi:hypothetical protein
VHSPRHVEASQEANATIDAALAASRRDELATQDAALTVAVAYALTAIQRAAPDETEPRTPADL